MVVNKHNLEVLYDFYQESFRIKRGRYSTMPFDSFCSSLFDSVGIEYTEFPVVIPPNKVKEINQHIINTIIPPGLKSFYLKLRCNYYTHAHLLNKALFRYLKRIKYSTKTERDTMVKLLNSDKSDKSLVFLRPFFDDNDTFRYINQSWKAYNGY